MGIPLNIDWQQILLHIFNLIILVGGLYFLLYQPVKKFMEKREALYQEMDREASEKLKNAQELEKKAQELLDHADDEITERRIKAEAELNERDAAQLLSVEKEAKRIIAEAQKAAEEERRSILDHTDKEILIMTKKAAAQMVHTSTEEAYRQFLEAGERDEGHA